MCYWDKVFCCLVLGGIIRSSLWGSTIEATLQICFSIRDRGIASSDEEDKRQPGKQRQKPAKRLSKRAEANA
ncbi:MAG: hypothetical protein LBD60_03600 [Puniceicoccales bacterium]|jgi:hypothetical protein|nr:hypothetical protein [Puniceicoccales bacterium]